MACSIGMMLNEECCQLENRTEYYSLSAEEQELVQERIGQVQEVTSLCDRHLQKYVQFYSDNQKNCCDPLGLHPGNMKSKGLRLITSEMARSSSLGLIRGKKLCTQCRKEIYKSIPKCAENDADSEQDCEAAHQETFSSVNTALLSLGESLIAKKRLCQKKYPNEKIKKIEETIRKRLNPEVVQDKDVNQQANSTHFQEMLSQLKQKFNATTKISGRIMIMTVLPQSWSIRHIMTEFNTTYHMARTVKKIIKEKGNFVIT